MTAPTPLAETIAAVDEVLSFVETCGDDVTAPIKVPYVRLLLACARRCEASDKSFRSDRAFELIEAIDVYVDDREVTPDWYVHVGQLTIELRAVSRILLDNAIKTEAERDALAKRVGELAEKLSVTERNRLKLAGSVDYCLTRAEEAERRLRETSTNRENELRAESTRLRAENERLAKSVETWKGDAERYRAERLRSDQEIDRLTPALTAAQDRVRELEEALKIAQDELDEWRPDTVNDGPITDPTQGVDDDELPNMCERCDQEYSPIARHVCIKPAERPSCVPADCQHFEQLPSGLWAWVEGQTIRVEGRGLLWNMYKRDHTYSWLAESIRETLTEPDFLAARALGARVLGWKP